jgi:predicted transcriptional regulator
MTSNPCTIDAESSVAYAAKMMQEEDVGLAPIVEGDKLIGMLTDRDIATRVTAEGRNPDQVKVRDVASKQLVTIDPQQDLDDALRMMAKHQVRRLPVVEDGRLVGVVAQADIAREGDDTQTGQLVEEISQSGGPMSSFEEGQFPRQVEDEPQESLVGQEPQVEEQQEDEGISKVQSSSRGRRKRSTSKRKTAARKSTGTRKRKTASRKRSTAKRSTTKRSTAKRKTTSRKRSTAKRSTAKRSSAKRSTTKRRGTAKKRSTAKRKTTSRKRSTTRRKTGARKAASTRKRKTATRKTAGRKAASTRKRKTATRKTAGRKAASTRKRKTATRRKSTTSRKTGTRRRTTRRKTR